MNLLVSVVTALLLSTALGQSAPTVRIADDLGGPLGDYILRFSKLQRSDAVVIIDGRCHSACTIVTGLIPRRRICVTSRAQLGFHAALAPDERGKLVPNLAATKVLYAYYPNFIKVWLAKRGGLGAETMVMQSDVLRQFYAVCQ
jgi:hypothetical protein